MEWYWILLIVIGSLFILFLLLCFIAGSYFVHLLSYPKLYDRKACYEVDLEKKLYDSSVLNWKKETMDITMHDNYVIHGDFYPQDPKHIVIFAHGYTWAREGSIKYAKYFYRHGYSLYLYDERGHADNKKSPCTLGYKESQDLHEICQYLIRKYGNDIEIGLHGESMGGATVLLELKHEKEDHLAYVIADSPFADMKELMKYQIHFYHAPSFLVKFADLNMILFHHYSMKQVRPYEALRDSKAPVLLIQGTNDTFIPPSHTEYLAKMRNENCERVLFKGAEHTQSYQTDPKRYEETVDAFLNRYVNHRKE